MLKVSSMYRMCSGPPSVMKELLLLTEKGRCYRCQRATVEQYGLRLQSKTFIQVRKENNISIILLISTTNITTTTTTTGSTTENTHHGSAVFDQFADDFITIGWQPRTFRRFTIVP